MLLMAHRSAEIWRCSMTERTTRKTVTFTRPFSLSGIDEVQGAGTYTVETSEELLQGVSFPAYRRIETVIFLPARRGVFVDRVVKIDPLELEAAERRDASIAALEASRHAMGAVVRP
jgi:hypothetical protein